MAVLTEASARAFPDFLIVGAAKAGTTALHSYLAQHPGIAASEPKETFYFVRPEIEQCTGVGRHYCPSPIPTTALEYARRFPNGTDGRLRGESCVAYLYFSEAAARIQAANPACKLLILLRDPAERAFSNYLHHVRDGLEREPFTRAIDLWADRAAKHWWFGFDYLGGSRYVPQIENLERHFPKQQMRVFWYDDFRRDPNATCRTIFEFLGVDPHVRIDTRAELNVSLVPRPGWHGALRTLTGVEPLMRRLIGRRRSRALLDPIRRRGSFRPVLSAADRAGIGRALAPDVERLELMTGRDLSHWLPR
jgi:Sulfotransferase domain